MPEHLALEHAFRQAADVDRDERPGGPRRRSVEPLGDQLLARAVLARDQHARVGRPHALHQPQHRLHGRRLGDQLGEAGAAEQPVLLLEPRAAAERARQLDLGAQLRQQARVVPRLLDVVAGPAPHRLHRAVHAAPRGHHDDGQVGIHRLELAQEVESFTPRRGVAGVVEVHQHCVEVAGVEARQDGRGRRRGLHLEALALEQQAERLEDVFLVVGDEDARRWPVSGVRCQVATPAGCVTPCALIFSFAERAASIRPTSAVFDSTSWALSSE